MADSIDADWSWLQDHFPNRTLDAVKKAFWKNRKQRRLRKMKERAKRAERAKGGMEDQSSGENGDESADSLA